MTATGLGLPAVAEARGGPQSFVLLADPGERTITFHRPRDMRVTGELRDVGLGTHLGTAALPDGRILLTDTRAQEILAVRVDRAGRPDVVDRVPATLGAGASWGALDPRYRYAAIASGFDNSPTQVVNLVDLRTFANTEVTLTMSADEELHPFLAGRPLTLFAGLGGEVAAYPVADLVAGRPAEATASVAIGLGSHGPALSTSAGSLTVSTTSGLESVRIDCPGGRQACRPGTVTVLPWNVDGRAGGRNARPRLAADGYTVLGALAPPPPSPEQWPETVQDIHAADLRTGQARRVPLGLGIVPRFALSRPYGVFVTVHPDGDQLHLVDVRPKSSRYLGVAGRVDLRPMTGGPVAGAPAAGRQARFVAASPDGRYAYATAGGDGLVSVVDTDTLSVREIPVPTRLNGGGYIATFEAGRPGADLMFR